MMSVSKIDVSDWNAKLREKMLAAEFQSSLITEVWGEKIEGFVRSSQVQEAPVVYLSSGVHGDEPAGPLAIEKMIEEGLLSDECHWIVCPMLNPSGHIAGSRENKEGVDLNRDYLQHTTAEVQGHVKWLKGRSTPGLMLSLHEDWESTGYYFYEVNTSDDALGQAAQLMSHLDKLMKREPENIIDDHEVREPGWIFHEAIPDDIEAWPEAIYVVEEGCPVSLTMETPSSEELMKRIDVQVEFVKRAVEIWGLR